MRRIGFAIMLLAGTLSMPVGACRDDFRVKYSGTPEDTSTSDPGGDSGACVAGRCDFVDDCGGRAPCNAGPDVEGAICDDGQRRCDEQTPQVCVAGGFVDQLACPPNQTCVAGQCRDNSSANISVDSLWVWPTPMDRSARGNTPALLSGALSWGQASIYNSGSQDIDLILCGLWLSENERADPGFGYMAGAIIGDSLRAGESWEAEFDVSVQVPPGTYYPYLECNTVERSFDEARYDDNILRWPEPIFVEACVEDPLESGDRPFSISSGGYELSMCDDGDAFGFRIDETSHIFISLQAQNRASFRVDLLNRDTGERYFAEEARDGMGFETELPRGNYDLEIFRQEQPFEYSMFIDFEPGENVGHLDLRAEFVQLGERDLLQEPSFHAELMVSNQAEFWSGAFSVVIALSRDTSFELAEDIVVAEERIDGVPPLEFYDTRLDVVLPPLDEPGPWNILLAVDPHREVDEWDESNNVQWAGEF